MKKVALIFGYSGFVGPYLAKEFFDAGYDVVGSDINEPSFSLCSVTFKKTNILDANAIKELIAISKPNVVINLAAISSVGQSWKMPQTTIEINVVGSLNILEASRNMESMPKIMFIGSSEEYKPSNNPLNEESELAANNPYGISKITQENFVKTYRERYGMKIYCVRSFNHTGVGQKDTFAIPSFCKQIAEIEKTGKPGKIRVGNLDAIRDFSDVRDVVKAYRMILEQDDCKTIFNVGSGKAYSLRELLQYIISFSRQEITIETDPEKYRPVDTPCICCDNSLIKAKIGWEPSYRIKETLEKIFLYYINN